MNNKQVISAALSALTAAAMTRCTTTDLPALLELHNTAANAVSALPDTGPLAGSGSSCAEFAVGTLVAGEARPLAAGELVFADPAAEALYTILINVISQHPTARMFEITRIAEEAAKAFKAGLAAFDGSSASTPDMFYDPITGSNVSAAATTPVGGNPFAPVFEVDMKDGKLVATINLKPGSVAYLVNATGPRSSAVRISADGSKHVLVHPLVEIEPGS